MTRKRYFTPDLFTFLEELQRNNNREWFAANKDRYERVARAPMLRFIEDAGPVLGKIAPRVLADPRPVGGSMFRIYRDVRFSNDKSPYKTAVSAHFRHESRQKDISAPGFYLHLEPNQVFMGGGLYHPDGAMLQRVRRAIAKKPRDWERATSRGLGEHCSLWGGKLTRPPRGFDPRHRLIEDLKRKDFVVMRKLSEEAVCDPGFMDDFAHTCRTASPMIAFVTNAIGLPW
ncbi:MAG: DUF2461 domain-containing protein [Deltaproteobacteria bacterium]|nr:DUF2461 domain-containing protein [Deltaproteobacteria bacterium]